MAQWIKVSDKLPPQNEVVLVKGHGHDFIYPKKGETLEQAVERISKIAWRDIGFYGDDGWYGCDGYPMIIAPEEWKEIDWS